MEPRGTRERDDEAVGPVPAPPRPPGRVGRQHEFAGASPTGDAHGDRWAWRRRIKADPALRKVYRAVVGVVGVALMVLAASIGWLPGPAGIPLFLLGLAILASEFEWAHRLLQRAKAGARRSEAWARAQPRWIKWLGGVATAAGVTAVCWVYLALLGVPGWLPDAVSEPLLQLPAVDPAG